MIRQTPQDFWQIEIISEKPENNTNESGTSWDYCEDSEPANYSSPSAKQAYQNEKITLYWTPQLKSPNVTLPKTL